MDTQITADPATTKQPRNWYKLATLVLLLAVAALTYKCDAAGQALVSRSKAMFDEYERLDAEKGEVQQQYELECRTRSELQNNERILAARLKAMATTYEYYQRATEAQAERSKELHALLVDTQELLSGTKE